MATGLPFLVITIPSEPSLSRIFMQLALKSVELIFFSRFFIRPFYLVAGFTKAAELIWPS